MTPVDQFSAVADPTRCRVVEMLNERAMPVHELTAAFSISRPAISRHLRVLKQAGLVKELKQGRENVYSLQRAKLAPMLDWLGRQSVNPVEATKPKAPVRRPKAVLQAKPKPAVVAKPSRKPPSPKSQDAPVAPKAKAPASLQLDLF